VDGLAIETLTWSDQHHAVTVLVAAGELDVHTAAGFRAQLDDAAGAAATVGGPLVVDLDAVSFLDSTGLGVLVAGQRTVAAGGGRLHLVCAAARILRLLDLTGVAELVTVHPDQATARAAVLAGA
jgi:anti-sigma B factor antagonist